MYQLVSIIPDAMPERGEQYFRADSGGLRSSAHSPAGEGDSAAAGKQYSALGRRIALQRAVAVLRVEEIGQ